MLVLLLLQPLLSLYMLALPIARSPACIRDTITQSRGCHLDGTGGIVEQTIELVRQGYAEKLLFFIRYRNGCNRQNSRSARHFSFWRIYGKQELPEQIIAVTPSAYDKVDLQYSFAKRFWNMKSIHTSFYRCAITPVW